MDVRVIALFVFLCLNVRVTFEAESNVDSSTETELSQNETASETDWSRVTEERSLPIDAKDKEGEEVEEETTNGKSRIMKRQIIKIPSGVTKVKVIAPKPVPQMRPKRMPNRPNHLHRPRPPKRFNQKRPTPEPEEEYEEPKYHKSRDKEGRRSKNHGKKSKIVVKDVSPEEFFNDDAQYLPSSNIDSYEAPAKHTRRRKPQKQIHYGSSDEGSEPPRRSRKPPSEKEQDRQSEQEYSRPVKYQYESRPGPPYNPEYNREEYAASSVHMKQVPAPNLTGLNLVDPPDMMKEARQTFRTGKDTSGNTEYKVSPSSREVQSVFPPQYTSHNPHVMTNFGLDDSKLKTKTYSIPNFEDKPFTSVKYTQITAGSEQQATTVSAGSNGLQIVQPPQLGSTQTNEASSVAVAETFPNQRATIRDILQQDCPDYEALGYCSSPPRYPTIQISNMALKCADVLDIMNSPIPPEPQDDLSSFSRRSDDDVDIVFDDETNTTASSDNYGFAKRSWPSWSQSGSDSETACSSEYTIIEPGYAREVTTGRWFVIVQNADSSLQKVTTDKCLNPGKPCGGLAGMKCSRNRGVNGGIKSTRCIQRYTHQRLISWDPEAPNKCPRIRIFRFPTACVCHLRLK
ncbi:UNVERIFIED_CONTAM: hypothetical protein PYX00_002522 [Menopon gallinae]|uniref:Spaetzle domain-containing protein n=1 Tax=Menopon gallinae TaxID=328185 RepID=A0AAW2IHP5_9NEOP